jgi:amino acid transporter
MKSFKEILLGKPLRSKQLTSRKLGRLSALAMLSPDALSSVAYGPEQIVLILATIGGAAIWWSIPIAIGVAVLLLSLMLSYRQIILTHPDGGGAYIVTSQNLGKHVGLVAGGSLLVDYMLTVAVSASAGASAITSAFPQLASGQLYIAIGIVVLLMIMNLRGLRESAKALIVPVYLFILATLAMLTYGLIQILAGNLVFHATAAVGAIVPGISLALLLRSFSSGAASLTGVEAISNGVPYFKEPRAKNAAGTLMMMGTILGIFFGGIVFMNYWLGILPGGDMTVLSKIAKTVFGGQNFFFYFYQFATALILAVAVNTGFSDFPMVSMTMARDRFMPHAYLTRGDRLSLSNGIITLATGAILLLLIFNGNIERLIPLYLLGVFIPFTLSQTGMIKYWFSRKNGAVGLHVFRMIPNFIGALISAIIVVIMLVFHLTEIWPFFIILPLLIILFLAINKHYENALREVAIREKPEAIGHFVGNQTIVLVSDVNRISLGALNFAKPSGGEVIALHIAMISTDEDRKREENFIHDFAKNFPDVKLEIIDTPYRNLAAPILNYVRAAAKKNRERQFTTTVLIPNFIPKKLWQNFLHGQSNLRIRYVLDNYLPSRNDIVIANYNYQLRK